MLLFLEQLGLTCVCSGLAFMLIIGIASLMGDILRWREARSSEFQEEIKKDI
jgi:hypothetical protein